MARRKSTVNRYMSADERFVLRTELDITTGCVNWLGSTYRGYGRITDNGKVYLVHRWRMKRCVAQYPKDYK